MDYALLEQKLRDAFKATIADALKERAGMKLEPGLYDAVMAAAEVAVVDFTMHRSHGSGSAAARPLGLHRMTVYRICRRHNLPYRRIRKTGSVLATPTHP